MKSPLAEYVKPATATHSPLSFYKAPAASGPFSWGQPVTQSSATQPPSSISLPSDFGLQLRQTSIEEQESPEVPEVKVVKPETDMMQRFNFKLRHKSHKEEKKTASRFQFRKKNIRSTACSAAMSCIRSKFFLKSELLRSYLQYFCIRKLLQPRGNPIN